MINFHTKDGNVKVAQFTGTVNDITADLMLEIGMVYSAIEDMNKMRAKLFKRMLRGMFTDEELSKKVFGGVKLVKLSTGCEFDPDEELDDDEDDEDEDIDEEPKDKEESLGCRLNNILDELFSLDPDELSKELDKALDDLKRKKTKAGK